MNFSDLFDGVAHKKLARVDLPKLGSNQHELNGDSGLRALFGVGGKIEGKVRWFYFSDDADAERGEGSFTFYDARARSAERTGRTEWRWYYDGEFLSHAAPGDWLIIAKTKGGDTSALVFQKKSGWFRAARALFEIQEDQDKFVSIEKEQLSRQRVEFFQQQILSELGFSAPIALERNDEDIILERFGKSFPSAAEMSGFAREMSEVDVANADDALLRWLNREEQLFRALENSIIGEEVKKGFKSVDDFIRVSLAVQNRRKSRMGLSLQNHLGELFIRRGLKFTAQCRTEGHNKPDFVFPGSKEYHNPKFQADLLVMLGAKSTAKDRWRQVLTEADRIPMKHLCTLEAGISTRQTDEMTRQRLSLVIPERFHETYTARQQKTILTLTEFIQFVGRKQKRS